MKLYSRSDLEAGVCGLADSSVWTAYLLFIPIDAFYAITIGVKLLLVLMRGSVSLSHKTFLLFIFPALLAAALSVLTGISEPSGFLQIVPFCVSLALTLALIGEGNCRKYLMSFSVSVYLSIIIYLIQWMTGRLEEMWGRWLFFGGSQANLGGEIFFAGVLAAAISTNLRSTNLRSLYFLSYVILALISAHLLQARSAMLAISIVGLIALNFALVEKTSAIFRVALLCAIVAVAALVMEVFSSGGINRLVSELLLLDDQYRGMGTGFVNRDEHWDSAWQTFSRYPVFGVGFGYFYVQVEGGPHNFWLYMITQLGLLSIISIYALARGAYTLFNRNRVVFMFCCSAFILTIFNDRFINMNAYPFLLYVILFLKEGAWGTFSPVLSKKLPYEYERLSKRM